MADNTTDPDPAGPEFYTETASQMLIEKAFARYSTCGFYSSCESPASHLIFCYRCNESIAVCAKDFADFPSGPDVVVHFKKCGHTCLLDQILHCTL